MGPRRMAGLVVKAADVAGAAGAVAAGAIVTRARVSRAEKLVMASTLERAKPAPRNGSSTISSSGRTMAASLEKLRRPLKAHASHRRQPSVRNHPEPIVPNALSAARTLRRRSICHRHRNPSRSWCGRRRQVLPVRATTNKEA